MLHIACDCCETSPRRWVCALLCLVLTLLLPLPLHAQANVLQQGERVPFEICLQNPTWTRPTEEEQRETVWRDPRYASAGEEALKTHPRWVENFVLYGGGARDEGLLLEWGGFWKGDEHIERRQGGLCQERQYAVSVGRQIEIWLKYHHVLRIQRLGKTYVLVVEPRARGFEVVDFVRAEGEPLVFIFVTPEGKELRRITLRFTPRWTETYTTGPELPPLAELPTTGAGPRRLLKGWAGTLLAMGSTFIVLGVIAARLKRTQL